MQPEKPFFLNPRFHINNNAKSKQQMPFNICEKETPFNGPLRELVDEQRVMDGEIPNEQGNGCSSSSDTEHGLLKE